MSVLRFAVWGVASLLVPLLLFPLAWWYTTVHSFVLRTYFYFDPPPLRGEEPGFTAMGMDAVLTFFVGTAALVMLGLTTGKFVTSRREAGGDYPF